MTDISPENVARFVAELKTTSSDYWDGKDIPSLEDTLDKAADMLEALSARLAEVEADCVGYQKMLMAEANSSLERLARAEAAEAEARARRLEAAKAYDIAHRPWAVPPAFKEKETP
jgi:hypothetical protein